MRLLVFFGLVIALGSCQKTTIDLSKKTHELNQNWEFSQQDGSAFQPAVVPGQVHLDLLRNGAIEDPYWEDNETKQRWIEEENWVYRTHFTVDQSVLAQENVELHFEGIDTYAEVYLNGSKILTANNMFRRWVTLVKPNLIAGTNELRVVFFSPIGFQRDRVMGYPYLLPSGNEPEDIPIKVASFCRKAAYHFGWDWGPRFVTAGIWKPIKLVTWNKAKIENVYTSTIKIEGNTALMRTTVEVLTTKSGRYELEIAGNVLPIELKTGTNEISHNFQVDRPTLWWSNGIGEPYLYSEQLKLYNKGYALDSTTNTYGIRTIELVNEPDSIGTSFYFLLNGRRVFMKGANYIPQDLFLARVTPEKYQAIIAAAKEANMNMLRVWGGGIYERDTFYDLCDQNGILVWQDFMFAGSLYPDDREFMDNIAAEVTENIKRLRSHPCIALWCGNNEIEVAWKNWGWQNHFGYSAADSTAIWKNYTSIFQKLIPQLVEKHHPEASYTSSSPLSNWGTAENFNHSSMHYWGVWHGREPFENFEHNVGRFMVEYGFQSYPDLVTLRTAMADSSLNIDSPSMAHRQKSYIGNGLISEHINRHFASPKNFEEFVELSQKAQALGLEIAIEAHLSSQPHCMGTLFWQFNDCWPGPSWSVIDYFGNKKEAYEVVKKAFSAKN